MNNSHVTGNPDSLTRAETVVLGLVDEGLSNQQISATLSITIGTVKCHLHRVYEKLPARNRTEAAAKAREQGQLAGAWPFLTQPSERNFR
jgi:ATP/maltotriose-dependent transcriptional regulator MalT